MMYLLINDTKLEQVKGIGKSGTDINIVTETCTTTYSTKDENTAHLLMFQLVNMVNEGAKLLSDSGLKAVIKALQNEES